MELTMGSKLTGVSHFESKENITQIRTPEEEKNDLVRWVKRHPFIKILGKNITNADFMKMINNDQSLKRERITPQIIWEALDKFANQKPTYASMGESGQILLKVLLRFEPSAEKDPVLGNFKHIDPLIDKQATRDCMLRRWTALSTEDAARITAYLNSKGYQHKQAALALGIIGKYTAVMYQPKEIKTQNSEADKEYFHLLLKLNTCVHRVTTRQS
jgi:hypothetical protein